MPIPCFPNRIRRRMPDLPPLGPTPSASVVIVTYKTGGRYVDACLEALKRLDYPDFETIVVDNASDDGTREALERHRGFARLIYNETNRGFAGGCNDGLAAARGDVPVFLNADTEVESAWLRELVRPFSENPRAAVAGCKMLFPDGRTIQHAGGILHGNGMSEHVGYRETDAGQHDEEREVDYVTGAGTAMRREFLALCGGGFDEDYFPAYCEELDLCWRARQMGYAVIYVPAARLIHHESPTLENQSPAFQRLNYRNRMLFCVKNYRLRDWLFDFAPYELHWLRAPWSKGLRRKQLRAYLDALAFVCGKRLTPEHPLPGE